MTEFFNQSRETDKRRALRREMPPAEAALWARLRGRQTGGLKFRRQYSVGPYVLDFYCPERKILVEIDGPSHDAPNAQEYDQTRAQYLTDLGLRILRFPNAQVYQHSDLVVAEILRAATE